MFGVAIAALVVVACSAAIGQGLCALAGRRAWAWWAPGAGFAAMLALAGVLVRVPGHSKTAAGAIAVATIVSLAAPSVRRALAAALPEGVPVVLLALAFSLIPFLVWRRTGILGEGMNNDSGAHLGTVLWLEHGRGPAPVGALGGPLAQVGYPLGPHGIIAALSLSLGWVSVGHAFDGLVVAIAPLTSLAALAALPPARRAWRLIAALLVGMSYLALSFQVQASFKETMQALLVLAVVAGTRDLLDDFDARLRWRAAIPIGVAIAGSVYVYSYGGLVWPVAAAAAVVLAMRAVRTAVVALPGFLLAAAVVIAPQLHQMARFAYSPFGAENGEGNLLHAISPFELLGVWFNYDFRWTPDPLWPTVAGIAVVSLAAVVAVTRLLRRHDLVLIAGAIPIVALYAFAAGAKNIYLGAKAGAIAAPIVALVIAAGLLLASERRRSLAVGVLAALTAALAAWSSFLVLRDARVGPTEHHRELAQLRTRIKPGDRVLFMPKNDFVQWDLVGLTVAQARTFYSPLVVPKALTKPNSATGFTDFDAVSADTLDEFTYAISTNSPYQSAPPPNWRQVAHTRSYILWKRDGPTPMVYATDGALTPGRMLDCASAFGKRRVAQARGGYAVVEPRPVLGPATRWSFQPPLAGQSGTMTLRVPRGVWDLSLAYASNPGLIVEAGALRRAMPATIDRNGTYYLVGTVRMRAAGTLRIRATQEELGWFGRALGSRGRTRGLDSPWNWPLGGVALTRHGVRPRRMSPQAACGRYVDHMVAATSSA